MRRKLNSRDRLKKTPLSLYLDPPQAKALRELSARTRVPAQAYLREGLDHILAKYGKKSGGSK